MASKKEVTDRVNEVIWLLAKGVRPTDICQTESVKAWGVDERQVWRYIGKAYKYFEEKAQINRDMELGKILTQLDLLYRGAVLLAKETKDFASAAGILDKRAELIGLKTLKVDATGNMTHNVTFAAKEDIEKL